MHAKRHNPRRTVRPQVRLRAVLACSECGSRDVRAVSSQGRTPVVLRCHGCERHTGATITTVRN